MRPAYEEPIERKVPVFDPKLSLTVSTYLPEADVNKRPLPTQSGQCRDTYLKGKPMAYSSHSEPLE